MENQVPQVVIHRSESGKYRVVFERIGTAKGKLGYKVEAIGDEMTKVLEDARFLQTMAETTSITYSSADA